VNLVLMLGSDAAAAGTDVDVALLMRSDFLKI
jgi:hypothetical protein